MVKNQIKLLGSSRQTLDKVAQDTGKKLSYYVDTQCSMAQVFGFSKLEIGISMKWLIAYYIALRRSPRPFL